jgi:hypothetical protein
MTQACTSIHPKISACMHAEMGKMLESECCTLKMQEYALIGMHVHRSSCTLA